jgi:hypothetical protein
MSKEISVMVLGIVVALTPYLGLPGEWRTILLVLLGLSIAAIGFLLRRDVLTKGASNRADFFVDNRPRETGIPLHEIEQSRPKVG